ncbi:MAG: hypothetical protein JJU08_16035, partial [Rhodobacteraceae bacterium]|nr:hypothetical protein [Paracoccaceae bacterium]
MTEHQIAINGADLIDWGHKPGPQFPALLERAKGAQASGLCLADIRAMLTADLPPPDPEPLALQNAGDVALHINIRAEDA